MTVSVIDLGGERVEGNDEMTARAKVQQDDLRAVVTAVLPSIKDGGAQDSMWSALGVAGVGAGTDRDLALVVGGLDLARAFVLLGECLGLDPEDVWENFVAVSA